MAGVRRYPRALERSDLQCDVERGRSDIRKKGDGSQEIASGSPRGVHATVRDLCEKMAPWSVCVCVFVRDVCGRPRCSALCGCLLYLVKCLSLLLLLLLPSCLPVVGYSSSVAPCQEGLLFHWSLRFTPSPFITTPALSLSLPSPEKLCT